MTETYGIKAVTILGVYNRTQRPDRRSNRTRTGPQSALAAVAFLLAAACNLGPAGSPPRAQSQKEVNGVEVAQDAASPAPPSVVPAGGQLPSEPTNREVTVAPTTKKPPMPATDKPEGTPEPTPADCPPELRPSRAGCVPKVPASELQEIPAGSADVGGRTRYVSAFALEATAVTTAQWLSVDASAYGRPRRITGCTLHEKREEAPVNCVHQDEAEKHCKALGRRLPTAFELSRAADVFQRDGLASLPPAGPLPRYWTETVNEGCSTPPCVPALMEGQTPKVLACSVSHTEGTELCRPYFRQTQGQHLLVRCAK